MFYISIRTTIVCSKNYFEFYEYISWPWYNVSSLGKCILYNFCELQYNIKLTASKWKPEQLNQERSL